MERKVLSIKKARKLVQVSRRTIYTWLALGKLEYIRTAGGSIRIFVDTLWKEDSPVYRVKSKFSFKRERVSAAEASELVDVTERTIYIWVASGKVDYVRTENGSTEIFTDSLWRDSNGGRLPVSPASPS